MSGELSHPNKSPLGEVVETGPDSEVIVVFVHGSLDRGAGMARLAREAQRTHRTVRFDRRGYGANLDHPGPFDVPGNADDVVQIMDGRPAVLVGHSFGGNIALAVAERVPHLVRGVTTYETPLSWLDWWPQNSAGGSALQASPEDAAETFLVRMIGQQRWEQLPQKTKDQRRAEGKALRGELLDLRERAPWNAGSVVCPVLCGHGTRGMDHHIKGTPRLAEMLPHGTVVALDDAGHGAPVSHPREFHELLVRPHLEGSGTFNVTS